MGRPEVFRVKEDPVTLVNTEVARKSAVQTVSLFALSMPNTTNVDVDMPKITTRLLQLPE